MFVRLWKLIGLGAEQEWPRRWSIGWSLVAGPAALTLVYLVLHAAILLSAPWHPPKLGDLDAVFFTNSRMLLLGVIATVVLANALYVWIRKRLLETRRLRYLSGHISIGGGVATLMALAVAFIGCAFWLVHETTHTAMISLAVILAATCLTVLVCHMIEYALLPLMFSKQHTFALPPAIIWTTEAQRERLRLLETNQFLHNGHNALPLDFLPDREQSHVAMTAMLARLEEQLDNLMTCRYQKAVIADCDGVVRLCRSGQFTTIEICDPPDPNTTPANAVAPTTPIIQISATRWAQYRVPAHVNPVVSEGDVVRAGDVLARIPYDSTATAIGLRAFLDSYGNVAALYHPDYLPHLSHTCLKLSQMRALNMPPRRIQLLGRQWTMRGLESEYVVVHDVSDVRTGYTERSPTVQPAPGSEPKWRARPLKKRARVIVAPDGSLRRIGIEEERQFNI